MVLHAWNARGTVRFPIGGYSAMRVILISVVLLGLGGCTRYEIAKTCNDQNPYPTYAQSFGGIGLAIAYGADSGSMASVNAARDACYKANGL